MSSKLPTNFLIVSSLNLYAEFYQRLAGSISTYQELGNRVIKIAEQAQAFRQHDKVGEAAQVLINIPIEHFQAIGHYYIGLREYRSGKSPNEIFERVAEYAPAKYRARAMQSLAAIEARKQNYTSELQWLIESLKVSHSVDSLRGIAVVKAKEGYHRSAVKDLEDLHPLVQHAEPVSYLNYLNSLAVELGEAGRKHEARNIIKQVLASPFIHAYPEWQETARDLGESSRSSVAIKPTPPTPHNVLPMPEIRRVSARQMSYNEPARVLNIQQWKKKMGKQQPYESRKPADQLSDRECVLRILELASLPGLSDETLTEMVKALEKIVGKAMRTPEPDDTDGA